MARGSARGGSGPPSRETLVSKKMSWLLRHGAEKEGLTLGKGGYVNLNDILTNRTIKSLQPRPTLQEVKAIVATNEKQRFSLIHTADSASEDPEPSHYLIRANQGHSLAIADTSDLLTPITAANAPKTVVHGTRRDAWQEIVRSGGLKPMTRTHVHFATGVPDVLARQFEVDESQKGDLVALGHGDDERGKGKEEKEVLSGMRNSSTLLIYLDLERAMEAGLLFFLSENGVVLSGGDAEKGLVSTEYFRLVVGKGGKVILRDGKVVE